MATRFAVFDGDSHVVEPPALRYLPELHPVKLLYVTL